MDKKGAIVIISVVLLVSLFSIYIYNKNSSSLTGKMAESSDGGGFNLWCYMFPNLCASVNTAGDSPDSAGMSGEQMDCSEGYVLQNGICVPGSGDTGNSGSCCVCSYMPEAVITTFLGLEEDFKKLCVNWINSNNCAYGSHIYRLAYDTNGCPSFIPPSDACPPNVPLKIAYMGHGNECMGEGVIKDVCMACIDTGCDVDFESIGCSVFKNTNENFEFFKKEVESIPNGARVTISCNQCVSSGKCDAEPRVVFSYSNKKCSQDYVSCDALDKDTCSGSSEGAIIRCTLMDGTLSQRICKRAYGKLGWMPFTSY
jgi:hypothetical protein